MGQATTNGSRLLLANQWLVILQRRITRKCLANAKQTNDPNDPKQASPKQREFGRDGFNWSLRLSYVRPLGHML